jgi:hypothetical protein
MESKGHRLRALRIWRQVQRHRPNDPVINARIAALADDLEGAGDDELGEIEDDPIHETGFELQGDADVETDPMFGTDPSPSPGATAVTEVATPKPLGAHRPLPGRRALESQLHTAGFVEPYRDDGRSSSGAANLDQAGSARGDMARIDKEPFAKVGKPAVEGLKIVTWEDLRTIPRPPPKAVQKATAKNRWFSYLTKRDS